MPWIDELKNNFNTNQHYVIEYSVDYINTAIGVAVVKGISTPGVGSYKAVLSYKDNDGVPYKVDSNKNYMFKHMIINVVDPPVNKVLELSHFLDNDWSVYKYGASNPTMTNPDSDYEIEILNSKYTYNGYLDHYSYYNSLNDKEVERALSYNMIRNNPTAGVPNQPNAYIHNFTIYELDFYMNGIKKNIYDPKDVDGKFKESSGWYYNIDEKSYGFKRDNAITDLIQPYYVYDLDNNTTICSDNFISTKINTDILNVSFSFYDRSFFDSTLVDSTIGSNIPKLKIYLIPSVDFERWRVRESDYEFKLSDYLELNVVPTNQGFYDIKGLDGRDKYLLLHIVDADDSTIGNGNYIDMGIYDIKITGGYSDLSNEEPSNSLSRADSMFEYDDGENIQTSFIGNGKFLSGVWENGVWNNGVRTDSDSFEFSDVLNSYPISDGKWRIEIGRSSLLSTNEKNLVGEYISIGNIVVININEERKFLKKSYLVVDAIDNYIVIEAEFSFPVRRIEKDSDKHRMKVSKNVWLSGAFLNGRFEGIWNDGVFKGNAFNNVMENTQWIDGAFDGGRFKSNYNITGSFYNLSGDFYIDNNNNITTIGISSNEINSILYAKLSVNGLDKSPLVGDTLNITDSKNYNGDSKILEVEQVGLVYNITIDKEYLPEDEIPVFSPSSFETTGVGPTDSSLHNKLLVSFDSDYPTTFNVGDFVRIYNVSNSTITTLGLDANIGTPEGIILEVLEVIEQTASFGQKVIFDTTVSPYSGSETSAKLEYPYLSLVKSNLKLLISNGLIQNFTFNDNNLSKLTSNNSISSTTVFKYNSWIDVNYDNNEAVNIGRDTKVTDSITGVNTSNNNLYGYPTSDVLSSKSKFRGSNTLNSKIYNLGTKFKKYTDFLGDSSSFNDPFDTDTSHTNTDPIPTPDFTSFNNSGWTFSSINIYDPSYHITNSYVIKNSLSFERTSPSLINEGKELKITSTKNGGILNNSKIELEKSRYSIVEFDLIDLTVDDEYDVLYRSDKDKVYPILSFSNLNYETKANFSYPPQIQSEYIMDYLPVYKNVNLLKTPNPKKIEYFFNKKHLMMDIKGYDTVGFQTVVSNKYRDFVIIMDNLKMYEVDMIPFFKYFNESNIFEGVQKPLVGTSPFIEYTLNNFPFIESQSIPFDSIDIKTKE